MGNAAFKVVGNVFISVYTKDNPTDKEALEGVSILREMADRDSRMLVITEGGAPTPAQRKMVYEVLNGREPLAAILSDSVLVRGVVTAMSWFNKRNRVFSIGDLDKALQYLEVPASQHAVIRLEISRLQARLREAGPKAVA